MTTLFERLFPQDDSPGVSTLQVEAMGSEYVCGNVTREQLITAWSLDGTQVTEINALLDTIDVCATTADKYAKIAEIHSVCLLATLGLRGDDTGFDYHIESAWKARLGI